MYGSESWTIKKEECQRTDTFELWFLRVPWTARGSKQSILKEINPEYSLEGLMLKLKLPYSGHLMQRGNSLEKTLMLGKIEGRRRRGGGAEDKRMDGIIDSMDMNLSKLQETLKDREAWRAAVHGVAKRWTWLSGWTTTRKVALITKTSSCQQEKAIAPHSSILARKIPWMEEPGRLQSMGSWRVGHNWATSLSLFPLMHWRRKWQPTPVFLPGESQGRGSLVGCTESDTTEAV